MTHDEIVKNARARRYARCFGKDISYNGATVQFVGCQECGAAVMVGFQTTHAEWHREL